MANKITTPEKLLGTLTSWQQIAANLESSGSASDQLQDDELDAVNSSPSASFTATNIIASRVNSRTAARYLAQARSFSLCSNRSDDSCCGVPVTPKQHHLLYKEYRLSKEIGSGAFGRVCIARRLADGKDVVVKEIKTTSLPDKLRAATMEEVHVLANLNHPNIVKYHDCFMDDHWVFIVLEYCNAGDLSSLIKRRAGQHIPENEVMFLFVQLCLALQYTHTAGVLHRDLKTSNVLLMNVQQQQQQQQPTSATQSLSALPLLKLGDFGVSKITGDDASMANSVVGTPHYLCPEMLNNKPYGRKSDVWALGCVLYEMCCLKKAFEGNSLPAVIVQIQEGSYSPLPDIYSPSMKALVAKLLTKDPAERPNVTDILCLPVVRQHLHSYFDWARTVPEAHPETVLAALADSGLVLNKSNSLTSGSGLAAVAGLRSAPGSFIRPCLRPALSNSSSVLSDSPKASPRSASFCVPMTSAAARAAAAAGHAPGINPMPSAFLAHSAIRPVLKPAISSSSSGSSGSFAAAVDAVSDCSSPVASPKGGSCCSLPRVSSAKLHLTPLQIAEGPSAADAAGDDRQQLQQSTQLQQQLRAQGSQGSNMAKAMSLPQSPKDQALHVEHPATRRSSSAMNSGRTTADSVHSGGAPSSLSGWLSGDVSLAQRLQLQQQQHYHQHLQPASPSRLSVSAGVSSPASPKFTPAARQQQQQQQQSHLWLDQQQPVAPAAASSSKPAGDGSAGSRLAAEPALVSVYVLTAAGSLPQSPAAGQGDQEVLAIHTSFDSGTTTKVISGLGSVAQQDTNREAVEPPSPSEVNSCSGEQGVQPTNLLASAAEVAAQARLVHEQQELIRRFKKFKQTLQLAGSQAGSITSTTCGTTTAQHRSSASSGSSSSGDADDGELLPPLVHGTGWDEYPLVHGTGWDEYHAGGTSTCVI